VAPTANIQVSTDGGATWSLIATGVPINRYGQAQYLWTVDRTTTGSTALIRVTSGSLTANSQPFLLANGGTNFYVDDSSLTGNQYTTAIGNDANSGKSPDQPMASLAALLRAYPITAGDTIYVDTGNYVTTSDAVLPTGDGGTVADPAVIIGPTNGGTAIFNRDNPSAGVGAIDITGANNVTVENLSLTGAYDGVAISGTTAGVTLQDDSIYGNAGNGIYTPNSGTITSLAIANSAIFNNIGPGVTLQNGVLTATLSNNQVYNNTADGIDAISYGGTITISGGAVYDNTLGGITANYATTVQGVQVHGNARDGIDASNNGGRPFVSGNTVYSNAEAGIYSNGANLADNLVYNQVNTSYQAIELDGGGVASGNTVYGSSTGLYAQAGGQLLDNLLYGNSGDGILLSTSNSSTVTGNITYGDAIGISGGGNGSSIENNLVYGNVTTGIALTGGSVISLVNNTVYQSIGQAVTLANVSTVTVENNILWVDEGDIISVAAGATTGFVSAYNLFYQGADATPATLGLWQGAAEATLAAWQTASGQDVNGSKTGNPSFVNIAGADQVLGGPGTAVGAGADDDFELQAASPAIDAANAYVAPFTDLLGQPRHDDPATTNTGIGYPLYVQTSGGASSVPPGTTSLNLQSDGATTNYTLPFNFTFYGTTYTQVTVASQGYLQFAGPNYYGDDTPSVAGLAANARIAPFWAAFNTYGATGDGVFVTTTATSVTFTWVGTADTGGGAVNFSATLNSDGSFRFDYGAGNDDLSPIIGVSAGVHSIDVLSSTNGNATMANANAQVFTPQPGDIYFDIGAFEFQGNSADKTPPKIVSISSLPANDGTTGIAFSSLTVTVSKPLDLVSANSPANYSLIKADSNGKFNTTGATVIPVTPVYALGSSIVTLDLPDGVLAGGLYQLTLSGTRAIFDQSGNALAGNGTTAGTDYVTVFTIDRSADIAPVATPQTASVAENSTATIVLAATDTQGNTLTYTVVTPPTDGALSAITNDNTLTYTPATNFYGVDTFTFQATDPDGMSSQAAVTLNVTAVDQPPVAIAQSVSVIHDQSQVIVLAGTDAETPASQLIYKITTPPAHGTLVQDPGSPNAFTYTPAAGYLGADSFSFTVTDTGNPPGSLGNAKTSAPEAVTVAVVDPAPVGAADSYSTRQGIPINVPASQGVLANDTDTAGDPLTATILTQVSHGTLVLNNNGSFTYTPSDTFTGTDQFTYLPHGTYAAGLATTVTITVTASVAPPPAPPRHGAPTPPPSLPTPAAAASPAVATVLAQRAAVVQPVAEAAVASVAATTPADGPATVATALVTLSSSGSVQPTALASVPLVGARVATKDLWLDTTALMAAPDRIVLPSFTLPGDEISALVLPAAPEISYLPEAFLKAAKWFVEQPPATITFVDPVTGQSSDLSSQSDAPSATDPSWLLVNNDPDDSLGTLPTQIRWDRFPA
jgi:hypothetical protein